ncbi:MAG: YqgE/AlgH family protein [Deltaproteobacteria bacterium]|nr:YqgE/AlgH family protein [Deltaproteobacteria bacterium]
MTRAARRTMPVGVAVLLALAAAAVADAASRGDRPARPAHATRLAKGKFLVASRDLVDPNFFETVILLVDYDPHGALGVVVNRPTAVRLVEALPEVTELRRRKDVVFLGGPVARDRMLLLVRTSNAPRQSFRVFDRVYASGDLDALRHSLAHGEGVRAFAGYAGWGPGQLDAEVARGDWLIGPADATALFDTAPSAIWDDLVERFSGDWTMLSPHLLAN